MDSFMSDNGLFWLIVKVSGFMIVTVGVLAFVIELLNRERREQIEQNLANYSPNEEEQRQQQQQGRPQQKNSGKKGGKKKNN